MSFILQANVSTRHDILFIFSRQMSRHDTTHDGPIFTFFFGLSNECPSRHTHASAALSHSCPGLTSTCKASSQTRSAAHAPSPWLPALPPAHQQLQQAAGLCYPWWWSRARVQGASTAGYTNEQHAPYQRRGSQPHHHSKIDDGDANATDLSPRIWTTLERPSLPRAARCT